ncbi:hypothetical protein QUF79_00070 [Fictibacillus enclensis]|uniref:hypothetical protein n=1 Tax=Fictibacillus enclensis TaxID=1017270 RepID=UPI0025A21B2E|nr:hypothetical protein [Fictibacillus enclensis]MDM5196496.1 hypothetical protein [Fictibacillus enclensis]
MSEKVTGKLIKKQREKVEKLMSVFGTDYNDWLYEQHENYLKQNNDRALEELLKMREKFSQEQTSLDEQNSEEQPQANNKIPVEG